MSTHHGGAVVITGASRGIGAACARRLATEGYAVAVNYRSNREGAEAVVDEIAQAGGRAVAIRADTGSEDDIVTLFERTEAELGPLTGLVNNAGMVNRSARLVDLDAAEFRRLLDVNLVGYAICAREAVKRMSTQRGGRGGSIVNISSAAAVHGGAGEIVMYGASKGGVDALTRGLAKEVAAEGIRVNAIRPGLIDTSIHYTTGEEDRLGRLLHQVPMQRVGTPEEVAGVVAWLFSDDASYVTGAFTDVGGGR